jgi:putative GTP pyrophosphokinase
MEVKLFFMKSIMDNSEFVHWTTFLLPYKFALDEIQTKINILKEEAKYLVNYDPIEHVKVRLKKPDSIIEKLKRKGLPVNFSTSETHLSDIAGVRIICSFVSDIYYIYELISKHKDLKIIEVKDYIKNPKPNGYQSFHLIVEKPVLLSNGTKHVKTEIQIRTLAMDFWASTEHKIFYKYEKEIPDYLKADLKEAADLVRDLDRKMKTVHDEIKQIDSSLKDILMPS